MLHLPLYCTWIDGLVQPAMAVRLLSATCLYFIDKSCPHVRLWYWCRFFLWWISYCLWPKVLVITEEYPRWKTLFFTRGLMTATGLVWIQAFYPPKVWHVIGGSCNSRQEGKPQTGKRQQRFMKGRQYHTNPVSSFDKTHDVPSRFALLWFQ